MNKLFTSSGVVEDGVLIDERGQSLCMRTLPSFLRVLLTTDGTVTKSIESYFWEPVNVVNLGQKYVSLECGAPLIDKEPGDRVLERQVNLIGGDTNTHYAHARSLICTQFLAKSLKSDLEEGRVGIGELLRECGLETYREIMEVGFSTQRSNPGVSGDVVWRTYRIVMEKHPLIQITESFPLSVYQ